MNIGFLGCSKIGDSIIKALKANSNVTLYGCAARDFEKAEEYKDKYGFKKAYKNYEEMVLDQNVEFIYISTLMCDHYKHAKLCLTNGKPCLVEKAFTMNSKEAEELIRLSKQKNLFLGEAIWTRYMPSRKMINELIVSGIIGNVYMLSANLSYKIDEKERLIKKELVLGSDYKDVKSTMIYKGKGVEEVCLINLFYKNGVVANLYTSMNGNSDRSGIVYGTEGYLKIDNINNPSFIEVYGKVNDFSNAMELKNTIHIHEDVNGYEYQFYEAILAIKSGINEPVSMPHSETLKVMKLIDKIKSSSYIVNN